jgi:penicillin-binding protein 1A
VRTYLKLALTILATGAFVAATAAALTVPARLVAGAGEGEPTEITLDPLEQRSHVYASDGSVLAGLHGGINREPVELDEVPEHLINAIIAVEDQGFWQHDGVDGRGLLRAFSVNVGAGGVSQGGSTLTQQVVKLSLLGDEQSLERKVQELILARRLEREFSKEEILTRYINTAYFGNGAYGVEAAAETYFGVSASELDIGQSALLAGMIRSPRYNDPVRYPENAESRRGHALLQMEEMDFISENERIWFDAAPLPEEVQESTPPPDDYFVDIVRQEILDEEDERFNALGTTAEERAHAVYQGGIRVHTTFDPRAQVQAIAARNEVLPGENAVFDAGGGRQGTGAMVSVDPRSGAVRTMVAGPGFERGVEGEDALGDQFNLVTQNPRQIGSTAKTFTLTEAMEQGYSIFDRIDARGPCRFDNPEGAPNPYEARNYGGRRGEIDTLLAVTSWSTNCGYIRLALLVGYQNVAATAERMGVTGEGNDGTGIGTNLAAAIGSSEVTPLEMANAYATLANEGVHNEPYYIERIEGPDGRVIYEHEPSPPGVGGHNLSLRQDHDVTGDDLLGVDLLVPALAANGHTGRHHLHEGLHRRPGPVLLHEADRAVQRQNQAHDERVGVVLDGQGDDQRPQQDVDERIGELVEQDPPRVDRRLLT